MIRLHQCMAAGFVLLIMPTTSILAAGLPHTFFAGDPIVAEEINDNFAYAAPLNVVHVSRIPGASETVNGAALLDALDTATLSTINGSPGSNNPYLIRVAPGTYNLGTSTATVPIHVHLQGSGPGATVITGGGTDVVSMSAASSIRDATVTSTSSSAGSAAILVQDATGGVVDMSNLEIRMTATNSGIRHGIRISNATEVNVRDTRIRLDLTGGTPVGITSGSATLRIDGVRIHMTGSGTATNGKGLASAGGGTVVAHALHVAGSHDNAAGSLTGVEVGSTTVVSLQDARIVLSGSADRDPLFVNAFTAGALNINHSTIISGDGTASDHFLRFGSFGGTVRVGASQLASSNYVHPDSGTVIVDCAYIYDVTYQAVNCIGPIF